MLCLTSGRASKAFTSLLILAMMGCGVPAGANSAHQVVTS
ncbi:Uncharacterised protein [Bordetella pertussis]|nr:Uncharacterised protein [Bordetella pertussis]